MGYPPTCPAANSSGWPSPEPWPRGAKSSWRTNPPETWIPNIVAILKDLAHTDGCTVIIVTHDPAVAEEADTVLQMKDGSFQ